MLKIVLFILFFVCNVYADFNTEISDFDKNFIYSKQDKQLKFHHQLKNLYIQSIIAENESNKIEILKRLIISSNALNLDDSNYANELLESGFNQNRIDNLRKAFVKDVYLLKDQNKTKNFIKSPKKIENKIIDKNITNQKIQKEQNKSNIVKQDIKKEKVIENNKSNEIKSIKNIENNKILKANLKLLDTNTSKDLKKYDNVNTYVLNSQKQKESVRLFLNKKLSSKNFESFSLEEPNNFRYISDFEGILEGGKKTYLFDNVKIIVSQYNPKTIRMVIYSKNKLNPFLSIKEEIIDIYFNDKSKDIKSVLISSKVENKEEDEQEKEEIIIEEKEPLYVLDVDKLEDGIKLNLSDNINSKSISVLNLKDKDIYRKVFSFEGILEGDKKTFYFGNDFITITQFDPKVVRVVLSSPKQIIVEQRINNDELSFRFKTKVNKEIEKEKTPKKITNFRYGKVVMIDAGHGGKDSGSLGVNRYKEKEIVLNVALKLAKELQKRGYKVLFTRKNDIFINLRDRTKMANDKKVDLFISIHANAAPNKSRAKKIEGLETFFLSPARSERSKKAAETENQGDFEEMDYFSRQSFLNFLNREKIVASNKLAIDVQKEVLAYVRKKFKVVDGGVREAPFWVLVGAQMPAILLEIGYITHPVEGKRIKSKLFQDYLAKGIANGIDNYFYNNR